MSPLGRRRRDRGEAAEPAPFVVGVGRSGTTLLRLMLDAHPLLAIPPETHFVPEVIERGGGGAGAAELAELIVSARTWPDFGLDAGELHRRVEALDGSSAAAVLRAFYGLYAERQGKPRWGDKTPIYVRRLRLIGGELPEARFVHLLRDGRDVELSRRRRGWGEDKPIAHGAERWKRRIEAARRQAARLRGRYLELRYEDLVADPEPALRRVCELLELGFDPAMLEHHRGAGERLAELGDLPAAGGRGARAAAERSEAHALAAGPPAEERAGVWREAMAPADIAEYEAVAGELLAELGYELSRGG